MIRRNSALENLAGVFIIITLIAVVGALVTFAIRAMGLNRPVSHVLSVPNDYGTIQAAISAAAPGDMIRVSPGTYIENLTLDKPVSLVAETFDQINPVNNSTIIDGGAGGAAIMIPAGLTQMPVIHGFVIQNGTDGINAQSQFIAEYNYFHSSRNLVNYQLGAGGINRSNVYFQAGDDAIHVDNLNRPLLIDSNRIMYSADDGIEMNLQNTSVPPAIIDIGIWNNMIIGSGEDGVQFVDFVDPPLDTNRRFTIMGNLIANNTKAGIGLMPNTNTVEDYSGADTAEAIRVLHNTLYGNDHGISGGDNLVVLNSIIVNSTTRGVWKVQGPTGANATVVYTLFHNNRLDAEQSTLGVGDIIGQDPLFQAAPNPGPDGAWGTVDDDFSGLLLQSGSPAIDKGVTQFIANNGEPIPPSPITGFTGAAPDLGWREFGSPIFITPTSSPIPSATPLASLTPVTPSPTAIVTFTPLPSQTSLPTVTPAPATPLPSATVSVATATSTIASPLTVTPQSQVTITNVVPNSAQVGASTDLTLTGTGFANGAVVVFEGGDGPAPEVVATQVLSPTTIRITVKMTTDASPATQVWDIRVTNPDASTAILLDAFTTTL